MNQISNLDENRKLLRTGIGERISLRKLSSELSHMTEWMLCPQRDFENSLLTTEWMLCPQKAFKNSLLIS